MMPLRAVFGWRGAAEWRRATVSGFNTLEELVALGIANGFLFIFMDRWVKNRAGTIATGWFEGARMPFERRQYLLKVELILNSGTVIVIEGMLAIGWWLIGKNAGGSDVKLFAYLVAFIDSVAVAGCRADRRLG